MAGLADLVISLTAETAQFRTQMERASKVANDNFTRMTNAAKMAGGAIAAFFAIRDALYFVKSTIDAADALDNLSQKTGIAVDELSRLQYAAKINEVSAEDLNSGLAKLARSVGEAGKGTGDAAKAFTAMGVNIKDANGNLRSSTDILYDVADAFSSYREGIEKTNLAQAIFGKSGDAYVNLLTQGRDGIKKLGDEAQKLGAVITPQAAKQAAEFNDNLDRMAALSKGAAISLGNVLLPTLNKLANEFLLLQKYGVGFAETLQMGLRFGNYQDQIRAINEELSSQGALMDEGRKASLLRQKAVLVEAAAVQALATAEGDLGDAVSRRFMRQNGGGEKKAAPMLGKDNKEKAAADEAQKLIDAQIEAYQKLIMTEDELSVSAVFLAGGTMQQVEAMSALIAKTRELTNEQERQTERNQALIDLANEYKALAEATASPVQQLANEEARLEELRKRLIAAGYEVADVENKIAEARMNAADKAAGVADKTEDLTAIYKDFGQAIGTAFEDAIISGKGLQDVMKGLEQDIMRIITRQLVTKPLEQFIGGMTQQMMGGGGSWLSSFFAGPRALGGPVVPGQSYLVGENGPEIFSPSGSSGSITPMGNGGTTNININVSGMRDSGDMKRSAAQIASMAATAVQRGRRNL